MANTPNLGIPKPVETDNIDEEMRRLQGAWDLVDLIFKSVLDQLLEKAGVNHTHTIDQIGGLVTALNNKMAADKTFAFSELSDVLGFSSAPPGYIPSKNTEGKIIFSSAAAAIGNHQHSTSDIQGLGALIQQYITALVDSSPATLDSLKELAAALGNDPNFATTMTTALSGKVNDTGDTMTGRLLISGASPAGLASTKANTLDNGIQITVETTGPNTGSVLGPKIHYHKAGVVEWAVGISNGPGNGVFAGFAGGSPSAGGSARWWFTTDGQLILTDGTNTSNYTKIGDIGFSGGMASEFGSALSAALRNRPPPTSLGAGAVGSYLFANYYNGTSNNPALNPGDLVSGSQIFASGDNTSIRGAQQTGTWRVMGQTTSYNSEPFRGTTLFLRVS